MGHTTKKILIVAAIGLGIYATKSAIDATPHISRYVLTHYKDDDIEEYVKENLEKIIQHQEQKVGIRYDNRPNIEYLLPSSWRWSSGENIYGIYDSENNTIYLNSGLLTHPFYDVGDSLAAYFTGNGTGDVRSVLNHELGHFYCDTLAENMGLGNWPSFKEKMSTGDVIGLRLVIEGIAEYIERKSLGTTEDTFQDKDWPDSISQFYGRKGVNNYLIYRGGYHLVKPIIDKYSTEGILHLMLFPPKSDDLLNLPSYQQKIMNPLEQEN